MKMFHRNGGIASCPGHFTPGEIFLWHPLDRRLGGSHSWSGCSGN